MQQLAGIRLVLQKIKKLGTKTWHPADSQQWPSLKDKSLTKFHST